MRTLFLLLCLCIVLVFAFLLMVYIIGDGDSNDCEYCDTVATFKNTNPSIPKIIHQSWKTTILPPRFLKWSNSWRQMHKNYKYILWTDEDNDLFVKKYYPWFYNTYQSFPRKIMKVDSVRYMYLHHFGGMYIDLDTKALKSFEPLFNFNKGSSIWVSILKDDLYHDFSDNIPNVWMASSAGHPFWIGLLKMIQNYEQRNRYFSLNWWIPEKVTGPNMLRRVLLKYIDAGAKDVQILPSKLVYPFDWSDKTQPFDKCFASSKTFDDDQCDKYFPEAYCITYWSHSWDFFS